MRWKTLYDKIEMDLTMEAEDNDGLILLKQLNEIIEDRIGYDERTKKRVRELLLGRKILKVENPGIFIFLPYIQQKKENEKALDNFAGMPPSANIQDKISGSEGGIEPTSNNIE